MLVEVVAGLEDPEGKVVEALVAMVEPLLGPLTQVEEVVVANLEVVRQGVLAL